MGARGCGAETAEALTRVVAQFGDHEIETPDGRLVLIADYADELRANMARAQAEADLHIVAARCFVRGVSP